MWRASGSDWRPAMESMNQNTITGGQFREMIFSGAALLEKNRNDIDALNVFPVPDGDTGTNMLMTMQSAVKEVRAIVSAEPTVSAVSDALAMGALRGARGNSGVILSQLFRGFSKACKGADGLSAELFSAALTAGAAAAYKAVMKPKEGTILTVAKRIAEAAEKAVSEGKNVYGVMDTVITAGNNALLDTPNLLPVLKEAGVVDSGGMGLLTIYRGFKISLDGEDIGSIDFSEPIAATSAQTEDVVSDAEIVYGYCTEFTVIHLTSALSDEELDSFRKHLERAGDSVVCVAEDDFVKVHVHTNSPGKVLQMALRYGELGTVKVENMREQNRKVAQERKRAEKEYAMIAVSAGPGLDELFTGLSVDEIITGGQTMNPSTDSFVTAIKKVNARNVIILPNNGNIIMAAQQAALLVNSVNVTVLPTKTIPQGISAAMAFDPAASLEDNKRFMTDAFSEIVSGSVTYAVRTTKFRGNDINEGDIIGMVDGDLTAVGRDINGVTQKLIESMVQKKGETDGTIALFYGCDITEETAQALTGELENLYPDACIAAQSGGQPLYYYYISLS